MQTLLRENPDMKEYIPRLIAPQILEALKYFPVVVICGPRQSGKTSLSLHLCPDYKYVNLENITDRVVAASDPINFIDSLGNTAIIDEVQNVPELLSMIQVRVDVDPHRRYILTGSSNFSLLKTISQSLAGRAAIFTLLPFSLQEIKSLVVDKSIDFIMWNGLYPRVIGDGAPASIFFRSYYNTYVERDLRDLLRVKNIIAFGKFMRLLAARVGSEFNSSSVSREVGVSSVTISEWLSILATSYIAFPLRPYYTNISKQMTKMPKVYFYDTGLLCYILGIETPEQLERFPNRGAIFENLAICELVKRQFNAGKDCRLYFYRDKSGLEADAVLETGSGLELYEIKTGATLQRDYAKNMKEITARVKNVRNTTVIYSGQSIPPAALNIRDI